MKTQEDLMNRHGTPTEFAAACNAAADGLMISTDECEAAIAKYQREWDAAARRPAPRGQAASD